MEVADTKGLIYQFGNFVLNPEERTLSKNGLPVQLPPKEFDTLLLLVEHNGRALSKEQMIAAIWQDTVVEEGNLAKQISRLRKLLRDVSGDPIETIPKHGYRLTIPDLRLREPEDPGPLIVEKRTVKRLTLAYPVMSDEDRPGGRMMIRTLNARRWWLPATAVAVIVAATFGGRYYVGSQVETKSAPASGVRSLAVLPFKKVGAGQKDEYFRLGLTDALITKLSGLKQVTVRPTSAVRPFADEDPRAAGKALEADTVLDGNVQEIDQKIRVTVQLIDVKEGRLLWGEKFDQDVRDIFSVQDAISEQVARAIVPGLTGDERSMLTKRYTVDPEAHRAYVMGRYYWNRRTASDLRQAIDYFGQAIARDPNYAMAYSGLSDSYTLLADYEGSTPALTYTKARDAAIRALELDPDLADAHTSLAYVNMYYYWDWPTAENGYKKAISLNPNYATAHQWYSEYLTAMGRFDEALGEIRRAREIDPLSPVIEAGEAWVLYFARRYDEAIERGRDLARRNPQFAEIHEYLKRCFDQKGMYREAIYERQLRRRLAGYDATETAALRSALNAKDAKTYWQARLDQENKDSKFETPAAFDLAEINAQLGKKDRAFEWLEQAFGERTYSMMYLRVAPNLDPLRQDPRFADLLMRVGLPE